VLATGGGQTIRSYVAGTMLTDYLSPQPADSLTVSPGTQRGRMGPLVAPRHLLGRWRKLAMRHTLGHNCSFTGGFDGHPPTQGYKVLELKYGV
jgi:hypothetical protein